MDLWHKIKILVALQGICDLAPKFGNPCVYVCSCVCVWMGLCAIQSAFVCFFDVCVYFICRIHCDRFHIYINFFFNPKNKYILNKYINIISISVFIYLHDDHHFLTVYLTVVQTTLYLSRFSESCFCFDFVLYCLSYVA